VARNTASSGDGPDLFIDSVAGSTLAAHFSLIGNNDGTSLAAAPVGTPDANGNLVGTPAHPIDPRLGPLANNGGPTQTMALLHGSPAVNSGGTTSLQFDQRGAPYARVVGGKLDMGAFEKHGGP
jgi:hypothetical protein